MNRLSLSIPEVGVAQGMWFSPNGMPSRTVPLSSRDASAADELISRRGTALASLNGFLRSW